MALKKKERESLKQKYGGRCAYCGEVLGDKWHADHIEPIVRNDFYVKGAAPTHPEKDVVENMNPACVPCNIDKHSMSLETWRGVISRTNDVLLRDNATFRRAVRYKLVELQTSHVVFYFETLTN